MKKFIDENGTFEISIPTTWKYSLYNENVHTFQEYKIWKPDTFQLSIKNLDTEEKKENFRHIRNTLTETKIDNEIYYSLPDSKGNEFIVKSWIKLFESKVVLFTLTYPIKPNLDLDEKIHTVLSSIKSFKLINATQSRKAINSYRFGMFLQGIGAASLILSNAIENRAFIEATCLLANQIDALLRIEIILKDQLNNNNSDIKIEWIYQGLLDKKKSEKDIYKKALDMNIINQSIFEELNVLYNDRNRVIHRFIISEITLAEVENISYNYYQKQQTINKIIYSLESEQIKKGIGMTIAGEKIYDNEMSFIKGKIAMNEYFDKKI